MSDRAVAARVLAQVLGDGRSLSAALPSGNALVQELCYGTLRWLPRLEYLLRALLERPLKQRDLDVHALLLTGLYQLCEMRVAAHAAVSETVAAVPALGKDWARGLVNGVLRNYLRRAEELQARLQGDESARFAHPAWLIAEIRAAWPQDWPAVLESNNQRPPMTLRVNPRRTTREEYLTELAAAGMAAQAVPGAPQALLLAQPVRVHELPGFADGKASVQDAAAQLAGPLLDLRPGQRVLDACAAPGGKTCQMLELEPALAEVVALDSDAARLERVRENLDRLGLSATLVAADAGEPGNWWDGRCFDRILLDAPCSATGVIRRHPDIKALRRAEDIAALVQQQRRLLQALWPLLAPGGRLVYATCSVLPAENSGQIVAFLAAQTGAREWPIAAPWGRPCAAGRQLLPGEQQMDGFYYAVLEKE